MMFTRQDNDRTTFNPNFAILAAPERLGGIAYFHYDLAVFHFSKALKGAHFLREKNQNI